ncbi:MAG: glycosyltransferase family 4 protein [Lachnospiraceae bacterium]|nr:glycosyltransferase family 4 protein [Lachnospiraceae bacterium]
MKILFCIPMPPPNGGITKWSTLVTNHLKNNREAEFEIIDISPVNKKKINTYKEGMLRRALVQGIAMFGTNRKVKRKLNGGQFDIIHITTSGSLAVFRDLLIMRTAKKFKVAVVYHLHFGRLEECFKANNWEGKLLKKAIAMSTATVAIDPKTYEVINKTMPDVNVEMIANPIDTNELPDPQENKERKVSFIGWKVKTKGVEELISAWNKVGKKFPDYTLQLIGPSNPEYERHLQGMAQVPNLKIMKELPHDKAMEEMNSSSFFVLPSYTEGFPYVILEAMALRTPIIATDVGAISEMIGKDGGILVEAKSTQQLTTALEYYIQNDSVRIECANAAYKKVIENYEISAVMRKIQDLWNSVCLVNK